MKWMDNYRARRANSERMFTLMEDNEPALYRATTWCMIFGGLMWLLLCGSLLLMLVRDIPFWPGALSPLFLWIAAKILGYKYNVYIRDFEEKYAEVLNRGEA